MRSILVVVLAPLLGACSVLDRMDFNGPSFDPNKIYLSPAELFRCRRARRTATPAPVHRFSACSAASISSAAVRNEHVTLRE